MLVYRVGRPSRRALTSLRLQAFATHEDLGDGLFDKSFGG